MVSYLAAAWLGSIEKHPLWFTLMAVLLMALAAGHTGKKLRAWRFLLNIRRSWLSREILLLGLFFVAGAAWLWYPFMTFAGILALASGVMGLFAVDRVYDPSAADTTKVPHSSSVFLTFFLFVSFFTDPSGLLTTGILVIKLILYGWRKWIMAGGRRPYRPVLSACRILAGIFLPVLLLVTAGDSQAAAFILILAGEMIDRAEFYLELTFLSPGSEEPA